MRTFILFGTIILCVKSATAQTSKGDILAGGALYYNTVDATTTTPTVNNEVQTSNFGTNLFGAYFIADNLATGIGLGWSKSSNTNNYQPVDLTDVQTAFNAELIARYYYLNTDLIKLWAGLGVRYGMGTYDDNYYTVDDQGNPLTDYITDDINTLSIGIGPGASVMLTPKLAFEIYLGSIAYSKYRIEREDDTYSYDGSSFGISLANSFGFGLAYHF
jgi:outer membrane immunogenic protein